jgi:hypothetical protein
MATLESAGLTSDAAARLLNTTALVAIMVFAFGLTKRAANGSVPAGVAGAAAVVLARDVLVAHAMIWTEPTYLALMLGALLFTARAIERDRLKAVMGAAVLTGAAGLVRYVMPALMGAIALSLLLLGTAAFRRKLVRAGVFAAVAAIPTLLLFLFNAAQGTGAADRQLAFHPPDTGTLFSAPRTAYYWFIPLDAPMWLEATVFITTGLALTILAVSLVRYRRASTPVASSDARQVRLMLTLVAVCYVAFLHVALTFVDAQSIPDQRLMLPVVPPLAILLVAKLKDLLQAPALRRPTLVMASALSLGAVASLGTWTVGARRNGLGYNAPWWRNSELMAAIRRIDPGTIVYSNHPGAILFQTGREVPGVPRLANPNSLAPNAQWAAQMAAICDRAGQQRVAYAHFTRGSGDWFLPSLYEVRRRWHSRPGLVTAEGILDTVPATCARQAAN